MRRVLEGIALLSVGALFVACTAAKEPPPAEAEPEVGHTQVAPYVDLTSSPSGDTGAGAAATGRADAVLAFVLAGAEQCTPSWGGTTPLDDAAVTSTVNDLKARGGTLTVASGGAQGPYLENVCQDAGTLSGAYAQALDAVGANRLDIDVEADVPEDTVAEALADLQRTRRTEVMLTVQVQDQRTGITPEGMALAQAAVDAGLDARINVMVMNFPPAGPWLPAMIEALDAAQRQVGALQPGSTAPEAAEKVGATVMIGRNDMGMTTTLSDAAAITDYADARGLGFVGFWSAGRDNGGCPGTPQARPDCSGVAQEPYAFAQTLGRVQTRPHTNR
jgi:chitinase